MTKNEKRVVGLIAMAVGAFMFMRQVRVYSWGWRGADSVPAIIIVLLVLSVILYIAFGKRIIRYAVYALLVTLVISVVLSARMYFSGSLLALVLTLAPIAAGAGLCIGSVTDGDTEE